MTSLYGGHQRTSVGSYQKEVVFVIFFLSMFVIGLQKKYLVLHIYYIYIATLLKVFINSKGFLVKSLGSLMSRILSANIDTFTSFPTPFISYPFYYLCLSYCFGWRKLQVLCRKQGGEQLEGWLSN